MRRAFWGKAREHMNKRTHGTGEARSHTLMTGWEIEFYKELIEWENRDRQWLGGKGAKEKLYF
jgi:hypothetical protein